MNNKINFLHRELDGKGSYTFEELKKEMQRFKARYPDGKDFKISCYHSGCEYDNPYIIFECYSPETKEEIGKGQRKDLERW